MSSFLNAQEPYGIRVVNSNGLSGTLDNQINVDNFIQNFGNIKWHH